MSNEKSNVQRINTRVRNALALIAIIIALTVQLQPVAAWGGQTCGSGCTQSNPTPTEAP